MANTNVPSFPYAAATDLGLTVASNNAQTTLSSGINSSVSTIPVSSTSSFAVPCVIVIDGEAILAEDKTSNSFTGCVRGFDGTTAASHTSGNEVRGYNVSHHHNQLAAEVKSVSSYIFNDDFSGFTKIENLLSYSEDFSQGYWSKNSGVTVSSSVTTLPNGSTMTSLLEGSSNGINMVSGVPTGLVVGDTYTFSVYAKYDSVQYLFIGQNLLGGEERWAWFDLQNGVIGTVGNAAQAAMVPISNGIYRCMVVTPCTSNVNKSFGIALATSDGTKTYLGTATDSNLIGGAQVRSGGLSGSHSYIKTSGTTFSLTSGAELVLDEGDLS